MTVQRPTFAQQEIVELGMQLSDEQIKEFLDNMQGSLDAYDLVDGMPDYLPPVLYPRTSGSRPSDEENPLNGWYIKTEVRGAPKGPLSGKTVALKDNVCLAGVPMMNGSSTLKGYTPDVDATVVTRLLDAGATITGKAHCEYYCFRGQSHEYNRSVLTVQGLFCGRIFVRVCSTGRRQICRYGYWRRSGRIYPDASSLFRLLWNEADTWTCPLYWHHAY